MQADAHICGAARDQHRPVVCGRLSWGACCCRRRQCSPGLLREQLLLLGQTSVLLDAAQQAHEALLAATHGGDLAGMVQRPPRTCPALQVHSLNRAPWQVAGMR